MRKDKHISAKSCIKNDTGEIYSGLPEKEMDDCWEELQETATSPEEYEKYKLEARQLLDRIKKKDRRINLAPVLKYTAVIALILALGTGIYLIVANITAGQADPVYAELYAANGERKSIILPDGSEATLNAGSRLRYPSQFTGDTRTIEIDGEAFLKVRPDKEKTFIVKTQQLDVKVLGTSFNIKAYNSDPHASVSVRTGKVQIEMEDANMNLLPDEMVILNKTNREIEKRKIESRKISSWTTGELYFNKTPISVVAKELERYYNRTIEIEDKETIKELVYGEHSNENLESVLKSLEYVSGIKNRKEGDKIILYKNN